MSSVCVCVPTLLRPVVIDRLLENLTHQTRQPDEILIIDSSPDTDTKVVVSRWKTSFPSGVLHWVPSKQGLSFQRRVGVENAESDLIFMLDDDVKLEPDCIEELERFMVSSEGQPFGGVGAYITNEYGKRFTRTQEFYYRTRIYEKLQSGTWLYCGAFLQLSTLQPFEGIYRTEFLQGGATMFRRCALEKVKPDGTFGFVGEDKHLTLRLGHLSLLGVLGQARLQHDHVPSINRRSPFFVSMEAMRNHAIILAECDLQFTWRRYVAFLLYHLLEWIRKAVLTLLLSRRRSAYEGLLGAGCGWVYCLLVLPRKIKKLRQHNKKSV